MLLACNSVNAARLAMCGIHGVLNLTQSEPIPETIHKLMGDVTSHRGPDDDGCFVDGRVLLGMRRLSIIDLEGGHQPIPNEDQTVWIVCNGEIYNFKVLRQRLVADGHRFRTDSDSEVIVHLYEQHGDDFVRHLDGMFGFALWDTKRRRLLVGRDRLGIKPLYYHQKDGRLIFASEAKAILAVPGVETKLNIDCIGHYLNLGYVATPQSIFDDIHKLPSGSMLVCEAGSTRIERYWSAESTSVAPFATEQEWVERVRTQLEASVVSQMVSDVPLGAFLSGGIDSSAVVAFMAKNSERPVKTYSIGFEGPGGAAFYNELPYARQVAEIFGTDHHEIIVKPNVARLLPRLIWNMDEPIADAAFITTYLVSEFASRDVKVILSGVGGDELFGGYRRYLGSYYGRLYNYLPRWLRNSVITPVAKRLPSDRHSSVMNYSRLLRGFVLANDMTFEDRYRSYLRVFSDDHRDRIFRSSKSGQTNAFDQAFKASKDHDEMNRQMLVDLATQLPDDLLMLTDKMSMATSLECRVPLLDQKLVSLALGMPSNLKVKGRTLKYILKEALSGVLPREILYRPKRGFGAPFGSWIKSELSSVLDVVLSKSAIEQRGLFDWAVVDETIQMHSANRADHTDHLLSLMNLELWCRVFLDNTSPEDLSDEIEEIANRTSKAPV